MTKSSWPCLSTRQSAHPSTELVARAATVPVAASAKRDPSGPRARHRQQHRLEVDKTRKRDVQTEGAAGAPSRGNHAGNSMGQLAGEREHESGPTTRAVENTLNLNIAPAR